MRVYVETYGCSMNKADSQLMVELLSKSGHTVVGDPLEADVVIVNTCTVRGDTQDKVLARLRHLRSRCLQRGIRMIVAGCMAKAQPYLIAKTVPEASMVTPQTLHRIVEVVEGPDRQILLGGGPRPACHLPAAYEGVVATIPIAEGCLGACSYCIVKLARGTLRSYPPELIVETVRKAVDRGAVEVQLTAQDAAAYGRDLGLKLPDLLREIIERVNGDFMVRVGMMNPNLLRDMADEMIEVYLNPKVYKFLHVPVQSGDDRVLKLMNRPYTVEEYEELILEFKRKIPEVSVATDIIVGHPGEDEEAFRNTVELVRRLEFDRVHVAHYSVRPHTRSAAMPQVPGKTKKRRVLELMKVVEEVGLKRHSRFVGKMVEVLFTETGKNETIVGRDKSYYPVIVRGGRDKLGKRGIVEVKEATFYDLRGRLHVIY